MYALAAAAAGVSALALAHPAEARIIYTPANVLIGPRQSYHLDFDKVNKFTIFNDCGIYSGGFNSWVYLADIDVNIATFSDGVRGTSTASMHSNVYRLPKGSKIGPSQTKWADGGAMAFYYKRPSTNGKFGGKWQDGWRRAEKGYLGLEFHINGKLHYGWARLTVRSASDNFTSRCFTATLTGYAFETVPGKAIVAGATKGPDDGGPTASHIRAPEPAALGVLALGAPGLSIWRREESVLAASRPKKS